MNLNQEVKNNYWRMGACALTFAVLSLTAPASFAAMSDCANPVEITLDGDVKMKFCEIPAASGVLIGSEDGNDNDERPVQARDFKAFQMGQFEVTQLQYKTITGQEPWKHADGSLNRYVRAADNNPAVYVSQLDAGSFAHVMSFIDKTADYRLPTEAEWEYAARAGTATKYYWGDDFDPNFAYYIEHVRYSSSSMYARSVTSCPNTLVNSHNPGYCGNEFGLMHMSGNVWEWTQDVYVSSYADAPTDGHVAVTGSGSYRVIRSGSWGSDAQYLRSASRGLGGPTYRVNDLGFRLVRMPK